MPVIKKAKIQPINLGSGHVAKSTSDLVATIVASTDKQVIDKALPSEEARDEFAMGSDALNLWRVLWRCREEIGNESFNDTTIARLKDQLCSERRYDRDEFESALEATRNRARLPFGWSALDLAWHRAKREPIRLLRLELTGRVPSTIANIAYQLQKIQGEEPILLPIDQLRILLCQRKIVVSGAVLRLVEAKIVVYTDKTYHTNKAREFKFTAVEGEHYVLAQDPENQSSQSNPKIQQ